MRIVVTGALGHIGSRFIREVPKALPGTEVLMIDNLSTQRFCSLFDLPPEGRYRFLQADVLEADLVALFEGADAVVHLAALTDAANSFDRAEEVERVNLRGTERVARACLEANIPLVFPSTTSVYGTQKDVVAEDCPSEDLVPQSPYAESKLAAERLLQELGEQGLRCALLRFGTIFGVSPGMRFHTAVNKFVWQACMGEPVSVWSTALDQRRPYLDLSDAVRALLFVVRGRTFDGEIYNVLTTNNTVAEILDAIRPHVPELKVEFVDTPIMNQLSYTVARDKFESLGFEFQGDLRAGLAESIGLLKVAHSW